VSGTRYIYQLQLQDFVRGGPVASAGGAAIICQPGTARKASLFNPDTGAAIANPISLTRGNMRFATDTTIATVDIYGFAPDGGFFVFRGARPGADPEIPYSMDQVQHTAVIPLAAPDFTAATEGTTGLQFPAGALLSPAAALRVTVLEGSRTIEVGLLSSETSGDADGLLDAVSLAAVGTISPAVSGTPTLGALLVQNFATTPAVNLPDTHAIGPATARTISVTFSASSATAQAFAVLPYVKPHI
jgi:hypothetical protein